MEDAAAGKEKDKEDKPEVSLKKDFELQNQNIFLVLLKSLT